MRLSEYQIVAVNRLLAAEKPTPTFGIYDVPGSLISPEKRRLRLMRIYNLIVFPR